MPTKDEFLKDTIRKMLPVVKEAYWDHWSAGTIPGSGYNHRCYSKLPFTWREKDTFKEWIKEVEELIEYKDTRPRCDQCKHYSIEKRCACIYFIANGKFVYMPMDDDFYCAKFERREE